MSRDGRAKCATMRALARSASASAAGHGVSGRILGRTQELGVRRQEAEPPRGRRKPKGVGRYTHRLTSMLMHERTRSLKVPRDSCSSVSASGRYGR